MAKLRHAILPLVEGGPLPPQYKDHPLKGEWRHFRDCHIEPDWLLIYSETCLTGGATTEKAGERRRSARRTRITSDGHPNALAVLGQIQGAA
jgi:hypothetical protein